ncbi:MAG: glycosyl hydrolase [Polaribacter sp.]
MKKYFKIVLFSILIIGCEKNIIGDFDGVAGDPIIEEPVTGDALIKKGVCFSNRTKRWSHKANELGAHWMYSWGPKLSANIPENVDFVPMFWGKSSVSTANLDYVKQLIADGKINTVLGFNEPDKTEQSNVSVADAIALWPQLEALGVRLGAPSPANVTSDPWLEDFMTAAKANNLRVDYLTVHHYGGPSVPALINKLQNLYDKYGLPIWVTEFAVADWGISNKDDNRYSVEQVEAFMRGVLPALDKLDFVERYSWFDGSNGSGNAAAALYTSALYDENDNLTSLGQIYADHRPNANVGPGVDTDFVVPNDPDEILIDGGFEDGDGATWAGYNNNILYNEDRTQTVTGNFYGRVGNTNQDGSFLKVANVTPGETYILKYHGRWGTALTASQNNPSFVIRNNQGNALIQQLANKSPRGDTWEEVVNEFTIPSGVTELKIVFYRGKLGLPGFFIDDVSLKLK